MRFQLLLVAAILSCTDNAIATTGIDHSPRYCEVKNGEMDVCPTISINTITQSSKLDDNEYSSPRPVDVEFINDSSQHHFHIKFIDPETLREDLVIWDLEPKNPNGSNFYSETIESYIGHAFDVISAVEGENVRIRCVVDEQELVEDDDDNFKAVFTITDEMVMSSDKNAVQVEFINDSSYSFHVNFIERETLEEEMVIADLQPALLVGDETTVVSVLQSFPGDEFAVYDEDRTFRVRVVVDPDHHDGDHVIFRITDDMIHPQNPIDVEFTNDTTSKQVHINFIDATNGEEELVIWNLSPKMNNTNSSSNFYSETIDSFTGHNFVAYDEENSFRLALHVGEDHVPGTKVTFTITDELISSLI